MFKSKSKKAKESSPLLGWWLATSSTNKDLDEIVKQDALCYLTGYFEDGTGEIVIADKAIVSDSTDEEFEVHHVIYFGWEPDGDDTIYIATVEDDNNVSEPVETNFMIDGLVVTLKSGKFVTTAKRMPSDFDIDLTDYDEDGDMIEDERNMRRAEIAGTVVGIAAGAAISFGISVAKGVAEGLIFGNRD